MYTSLIQKPKEWNSEISIHNDQKAFFLGFSFSYCVNQDFVALAQVSFTLKRAVQHFQRDESVSYFFEKYASQNITIPVSVYLKGFARYCISEQMKKSFKNAIEADRKGVFRSESKIGYHMLSLAAQTTNAFQQYMLKRGEFDLNEYSLGVGEYSPRELLNIFTILIDDAKALTKENRSWMVKDLLARKSSHYGDFVFATLMSGEVTEEALGQVIVHVVKRGEMAFALRVLQEKSISNEKIRYEIASAASKQPDGRRTAIIQLLYARATRDELQKAEATAHAKRSYVLLYLLKSIFSPLPPIEE